VDGVEVIADLLGNVHRVEESGTDRWRWTVGRGAWYAPLPKGTDGQHVEVLVDGEPAPAGPICRLINSAGLYLRPDGYAGDLGLGAPDDGRFDDRWDRFALSGTALVTRADTWRRIGGLAAKYFAYYEDIDWCWRANLAGFRLVYDPSSVVEHLRSATSGGAAAVRVTAERNRTLSMVRNGPALRVVEALAARWREGPDGGVRSGIARQLPWALTTRMSEAARRASTERPTLQRARRLWTGGAHSPATRTDPGRGLDSVGRHRQHLGRRPLALASLNPDFDSLGSITNHVDGQPDPPGGRPAPPPRRIIGPPLRIGAGARTERTGHRSRHRRRLPAASRP
jgi:hypothetical protein